MADNGLAMYIITNVWHKYYIETIYFIPLYYIQYIRYYYYKRTLVDEVNTVLFGKLANILLVVFLGH